MKILVLILMWHGEYQLVGNTKYQIFWTYLLYWTMMGTIDGFKLYRVSLFNDL